MSGCHLRLHAPTRPSPRRLPRTALAPRQPARPAVSEQGTEDAFRLVVCLALTTWIPRESFCKNLTYGDTSFPHAPVKGRMAPNGHPVISRHLL